MERLAIVLIALTLCGCAERRVVVEPVGLILADPPHVGAVEASPEPMKASFRIKWVRDFNSLFYLLGVQDVEVTLPEALQLGIPADLYYYALTFPSTQWVVIYLPRKMIL